MNNRRLHDLFITIELMIPTEYKSGGKYLEINYSFAETTFGNLIMASTTKGICHMAFEDDEIKAFQGLKQRFPNATYTRQQDVIHKRAISIFKNDWRNLHEIKLHLKGTLFQLKVWRALLTIPFGRISTYGKIAQQIRNPLASRAVGTAIGSNPVAFLIPCHRVIQASGAIGGYRWGSTRKSAIIGWEMAMMGRNT